MDHTGGLRRTKHSSSEQRPMLRRRRLLDVMEARFDRVATLITAGAGFGKSTLIDQTVGDPENQDGVRFVFHRIRASDPGGDDLAISLAHQIADIARPAAPADESDTTVGEASALIKVSLDDQLWHLSPQHVTVIVDDIHLLAPSSTGWTLLNELLLNLPDNADLILSGRGYHELTLARLVARGDIAEINEQMLAFTIAEVDEFARLRQVERSSLDDHGWPALAELEAHTGVAGAREFVAQEVLDHLPPDRVEALRLVSLHDAVSDELVAAVTEFDGTAAELVSGLPLTTQRAPAVWSLHELWRDVLIAPLTSEQRRRSLVGGARLLRETGQLRAALSETIAADDDDAILDTLVEFARDLQFVQSIADRRAVLEMLPERFDGTAEVELLRADIMFATEPTRAHAPLQRAIDAATAQNRPEVTVLALLRLGDMAYRSGNRQGLLEAQHRLARLHGLGGTGAEAALALTDSWLLLLENAAEKALGLMTNPALLKYEPVAAMVQYYRAVELGHAGRASASLGALDELRQTPDSRILERRGGFASLMRWWIGDLGDHDRAEAIAMLDALGDDRQHHLFVEGVATAALFAASAGDVRRARQLLQRAMAQRDRVPDAAWGAITVELATAVVELMEGDESAAAARLNEALPIGGPFDGFARHVFGNVGATVYALVPRSREFFDAETIGPDLAVATEVGRALVALRDNQSCSLAARLPWDDLSRLRTWAYEPHLTELALAAMTTGDQRAARALATLVHDARSMLRSVAHRHPGPVGHLAELELAQTPHRPAHVTHVHVLGTTAVSVGVPPDETTGGIRRKMVRELLLLLVHRRRMRRDEIAATLWPDKDDNAARNNLRATLSHLRSLLEQEASAGNGAADDDGATRPDDGPPWHVRSDGESVELFASGLLVLDVERFEAAVATARRADRDRLPTPMLAACREAIGWYRGEYLADALDPDWAFNQRLAYHLDFVDMCVRASELCEARADSLDDAISFARRAVDAEPLSERAHRALVRALRTRGDVAGARHAYERALQLLEDDGLTPEPDTLRLGAAVAGRRVTSEA